METTTNQIKKLGKRIRAAEDSLNDEDLDILQQYRTSFKDDLIKVFDLLCVQSRKINTESITTFRLKRFESIINKLVRFPNMQLNTMADIAGCRCILKNTHHVYKLYNVLKDLLYVVEVKDYIDRPKKDGYSSLHLFVKMNKESEKVVEIQLRNQEQHDWATLVEITDLLFDENIKENKSESELAKFHKLLSRLNELSYSEKELVFSILRKTDYLKTINMVFTKNQVEVRRQWISIESKKNQSYFILEASKIGATKISSYQSMGEAEIEYFNKYKENSDFNIVLTHLPKANFKQLSIAYSNYILTIHRFFDIIDALLKSLLQDSMERKRIRIFVRYYKLYLDTSLNKVVNLRNELERLNNEKGIDRNKRKEWKKEISSELKNLENRFRDFSQVFRKYFPQNYFHRNVFRYLGRRLSKKYWRQIQRL